LRILSTLIEADGGRAGIAGHDLAAEPGAVHAAIGVTGQFSAVDNLLSARENLILMADPYHLGRHGANASGVDLTMVVEVICATPVGSSSSAASQVQGAHIVKRVLTKLPKAARG